MYEKSYYVIKQGFLYFYKIFFGGQNLRNVLVPGYEHKRTQGTDLENIFMLKMFTTVPQYYFFLKKWQFRVLVVGNTVPYFVFVYVLVSYYEHKQTK